MKAEVIRRTSSLRKKSGKSVGGQPGHNGVVRGLVDNPDEIMNMHASFCTECGENLENAQKVLDYTTQIISLPNIKPLIREIRHYVMVCPSATSVYDLMKGNVEEILWFLMLRSVLW